MCHIFPCSMEGCAISFLVARMCLVLGLSVPRQNLVVPRPQEILGTIWLEAKLFSPRKFWLAKTFRKQKWAAQMLAPILPGPKCWLISHEFNSAQLKRKEPMV